MTHQLLIAGFHRSGTSLLAALLNRAGLFLGHDLLGALPSNPYGHYEDRVVLDLHKQILHDQGLNWQVAHPFIPRLSPSTWNAMQEIVNRRNLEQPLWGFKDPRVCFFLPAWKYLLPNAKVIAIYRHHNDACYSIERRQARDFFLKRGDLASHLRFWNEPDLALRMWLQHNRAIVRYHDRYPDDTLLVSFTSLHHGYPIISQIERRWALGLDAQVPTLSIFDPSITESRAGPQPVHDVRLIDEAQATLTALDTRAVSAQGNIGSTEDQH